MGQASHLFKEIEKRYENTIRNSLTQILKRNSQSSFYSNQCYDTVGTIIYFSVALFKNCILSTNNALARYIIVE